MRKGLFFRHTCYHDNMNHKYKCLYYKAINFRGLGFTLNKWIVPKKLTKASLHSCSYIVCKHVFTCIREEYCYPIEVVVGG